MKDNHFFGEKLKELCRALDNISLFGSVLDFLVNAGNAQVVVRDFPSPILQIWLALSNIATLSTEQTWARSRSLRLG